jgi:hypothetical protein
VVRSAPGATGGVVRALEAGGRRLDAGAEVAQTTVDPRAPDHLGNGDAAFLAQALPIAPLDRRRLRQRLAALQQPGHDPHRV